MNYLIGDGNHNFLGVIDARSSSAAFKNLHSCIFKPVMRLTYLDEELKHYYEVTKDSDNKTALKEWKLFKSKVIGYSSGEINAAKRRHQP